MVNVTTTVQIPQEIREECKKRGIKLRYLVIRGWESINQSTGHSDRLRESEEAIIRLQKRLTEINTKYLDLKERLQ